MQTRFYKILSVIMVSLYILLFSTFLFAQNIPNFLPAKQAFQVTGQIQKNNQITFFFAIKPGYYLYKRQFHFTPLTKNTTFSPPIFPISTKKYDLNFNETLDIYKHDIAISMTVNTNSPTIVTTVEYQGCSEKGLCYAPQKETITLATSIHQNITFPKSIQTFKQPFNNSQSNNYQYSLESGQFIITLLLFVLAGIGLAFTPCVLPMIPIVSSIIIGSNGSKKKSIYLTISYVLSMSITFAILGILIGIFGASLNLQAKLQSPWIIIPFSIIFILLAISMFSIYELQLPEKLRNKMNNIQLTYGKFSTAIIMGFLSALIMSPCVSAPLAGILLFISSTGNAVFGGIALLALGIGMGIPLILISIGGRHFLPKTGAWMQSIKTFFGFILLGVAIWLLNRVLDNSLILFLWGCLSIGFAIQLGAIRTNTITAKEKTTQTLGIILLLYGASLIIGASKGNDNVFQPLKDSYLSTNHIKTQSYQFITVSTKTELQQQLNEAKKNNNLVMVDVSAKWCISCKIMEKKVFPDPKIATFMNNITLIKMDITLNTEQQQQWMNQYQLFGPPALLFFDRSGKEDITLRTQGEIDANELYNKLNQLNG